MDDPWGSPWAADDSLPKLDLPTAPKPVIASTAEPASRSNLWEDDDAWGGWNGGASGGNSPGWGRSAAPSPARSPGLRPVPAAASRDPSPGPWDKRKSEDRIVDSAISLGREPPAADLAVKIPSAPALEAQDVWQADEPLPANEALSSPKHEPVDDEASARSESPDILPPGPALQPDERPEPVRQASKVQELVDMYDDIHKQSVSPVEQALAPPPPAKIRTLEDDEDIDSPIAETQDETRKETEEAVQPVSQPALEPVQNGTTETQADLEDDDTEWNEPVQAEPQTLPQPQTQPQKPDAPIQVDLTKLDELFPLASETNVEPEPIPDVIIDDTFANISERKTWYRISRFGSKRKHDLGNDENYTRMDWQRSTARHDSLKIVRRWMEEDSIAGGVVLGARQKGAIGASMFNWNSSAPAVEIDELLGRKRAASKHSKEASIGSKTSATSPKVAAFGWNSPPDSPSTTKKNGFAPEALAPVAAFGWNSPSASPTATKFPPVASFGWNSPSASPTASKFPSIPKPGQEARPAASPTMAAFGGNSGWNSPATSPVRTTFEPAPETKKEPPAGAFNSRPQSLQMPPHPKPNELASESKPRPQSLIFQNPEAMGRPSIDQALASSMKPPIHTGPPQTAVNDDDDDDDEWGEMVSSPTFPGSGSFEPPAPDVRRPSIDTNNVPKKENLSQKPSLPTSPAKADFAFDGWAKGENFSAKQGQLSSVKTSFDLEGLQAWDTQQEPATKSPVLTPPPLKSPTTTSIPTHTSSHSQDQKDDDRVAQILRDLPDLTYMLR